MDGINIEDASISDLFERFIEATTMKNVITIHKKILDFADLKPCEFNSFFPKYKRTVTSNRQKKNWKAKALFSKIEKRANHRCYSNTKAPVTVKASDNSTENCADDSLSSHSSNRPSYANNNALQKYNCLIIGSGPAGLRTAIELQLLGSGRVVIVEKRSRFSRNNVLHLWPFVIDDLKSLGAKKFYGKFCAGSIDHISIRQLQLILLKVCLMIGCEFRDSCSYIGLCPSSIKQNISVVNDSMKDISDILVCNYHQNGSDFSNVTQCVESPQADVDELKLDVNLGPLPDQKPPRSHTKQKLVGALEGANAHFEIDPKNQERELHSIEWDIIIGADGRRNTLKNFFPRKEFRGRLAIAITANFINRQTTAETSVPEISGLSFIYNQDMFNALAYDTNIELENICYYKDDTHYFVMTAKKKSLLDRGVLINDYATTQDLLSVENVNKEALLKYAKDAAYWTTGLEPLDFALNHYGQEDCAMFDFTSMYAASNACKALRTRQGGLTLVSLVGDSLLEPFWPTGSGCARGFLSSFDAAWMCRQWAINKCAVLDHHNHTASRMSRNGNANGIQKSISEPTTYDKMALSVIAERESIYRILAQTTSENLQQNYSLWTLNPHTRYPNLNRHLILPSQVEHLIEDDSTKQSLMISTEEQRRVKSASKSRRSPKKLKSAVSSPQAQPRSIKNKVKISSKLDYKSKSRQDLSFDDYYLKLEESYKDLADDDKGGLRQYLSYKRHDSGGSDDLFVPSLSGTLPSSHNLSRLEARKARDIDECLRHRRQKTKITYVRDQLISQMRGESQKGDKDPVGLFSGGNAAIFNEIKRMREQQSRGVRAESKLRDGPSGPLSLLNSMRRCASFAERVKSFESKLSNPNQDSSESNVSTPRTPIDNVRNLPQFATLQELFVNNSSKSDERPRKTHIPIAKLTKDDWNVKCWENRLSCKQKQLSASLRSLNKSVSVDSAQINRPNKPKKQIDIFQERINEMANKLSVTEEKRNAPSITNKFGATIKNRSPPSARAQGWVNHLKRELAKGSEFNKRSVDGRPMNPVEPNKPIRKLFEDDDDDDDDGIDVNKHYDHLCINRPTNKYLSKGSYTSHLARNNVKSKVINRPNPTKESKQAYLAALTSRGSSASSTLSDYSTNNGHSSSGSGGQQISTRTNVVNVECFRCKRFVSSADRITIGTSLLHRTCLTCADCKITLRSNEIQHYMDIVQEARVKNKQTVVEEEVKFSCAICSPEIRVALDRETHNQPTEALQDTQRHQADGNQGFEVPNQQQRILSREAFLSSSIDYTELYKNILHNEPQEVVAASAETPESVNYSEVTLILPSDSARVTPSPVNPETALQDNENRPESHKASVELKMIDEDELQRILHLDKHQKSRESCGDSCSTDSSKTDEETASDGDDDADSSGSRKASGETSKPERSSNQQPQDTSEQQKSSSSHAASSEDESSSLDPPSDTDDYDDDYYDDENEDNNDMNSTCDDFVTTEEFGGQEEVENADDDDDDDATLSQASGCKSAASGNQESNVRRSTSVTGLQAT